MNLNTVLEKIFSILGSSNLQVRGGAEKVFEELINQIDIKLIFQPIAGGCLYGPPKARSYIINKLAGNIFKSLPNHLELIPIAFEEKPILIEKHACPTVLKLLEDNKLEIKNIISKLIIPIYSIAKNALFQNADKIKIQQIMEIVNK